MNIITRLMLSFVALIGIYNVLLFGFMSDFRSRNTALLEQSDRSVQSVNHTRAAWDAFRNVRDYADSVLSMTQPVDSALVDKHFQELYAEFSLSLSAASSLAVGQLE
jgi:hypothetical protein